MRFTPVLCLFAILIGTGASQAFDGKRNGLVLGGGIGLSPHIHWNSIGSDIECGNGPQNVRQSDNGTGAVGSLMTGYGWSERDMIVIEAQGALSEVDEDRVLSVSGGINWYHYFGDIGGSLFTSVGIGLYGNSLDQFESIYPGPALLLGVGFELGQHYQIGLYYTGGKTSGTSMSMMKYDLGYRNLCLIATALAY